MTAFRLGAALAALGLIGPIVGLPLLRALVEPGAWSGWREYDRLTGLLRNTAGLMALVWLLAVPAGAVLGFLLFRGDFPGRRLWRGLLLLALFIPLPLVATSWQAIFGTGGWRPVGWWTGSAPLQAVAGWTPWGQGLIAAAWIQAVAVLPWVILLVGLGSRTVERELEEDALTLGPWPWVLWRVTLPRLGPSFLAATVWVVVQTSTEITVTDLFQIRTFAEEVYTQMVAPEVTPANASLDLAVRRATLVCLPGVFALAVVVSLTAWAFLGRLPSRQRWLRDSLRVPLGRFRWPVAVLVALVALLVLGVPLTALAWRAGTPLHGSWDFAYLVGRLKVIWTGEAWLLAESLGVAVATGVLATALALILATAARGSVLFTVALLVLATLCWTMPGPLVGQGYRDLVDLLLRTTGEPIWLRRWLHDGPSPIPLVAVDLVRFFPCALAVVWPAVHAVPRGLLETAQLDGLGPLSQLREAIFPLVKGAVLSGVLAVGLLTLGELAASKRASTPGLPSYAESLFTQMHYGVDADLAIRCLLLLGVVLPGALWLIVCGRD